MRVVLIALLALGICAPLGAVEPDAALSRPADEGQPVQLGGGVVLPRSAFDEIMAQEGGTAVIERMHERAWNQRTFEGVPHLAIIFVAVLIFFLMTMFYYQLKHARLHRTVQLMVEKGVPIPPEILRAVEEAEAGPDRAAGAAAQNRAPAWASNLLWGGLLWITIGIAGGLYLFLRGNDAWPWAIAAVIYGGASVLTALARREPKA